MFKYFIPMLLTLNMMLALPADAAPPTTASGPKVAAPAVPEAAMHPACAYVKGSIEAAEAMDPTITMKIATCKIPPAPHDNMGFYVVEIFVKENGVMASYGWLVGRVTLSEGQWVLGSEPRPLLSLRYPPVTKKEKALDL